jgi:6-phosphogluconate dehydrogenase
MLIVTNMYLLLKYVDMIKGTFGIIGLGKMGGNLALQAIDKNYHVCGYDPDTGKELKNEDIQWVNSLKELVNQLPSPRIIFIYIPAGNAVDKVLEQLTVLLKKDDIIVDGGNSYWGDSIRRAKKLIKSGIYFIDCGTSGGVDGARNGACFMAGGEEAAISFVAPILKDLSVPGGYVHTGPVGSGHFVKLVHNGIEFGMLQAIGEGMDLLSHYRENLNFPEILSCWNNGSVIRSWLIELMGKMYNENQGFSQVPSYIEDTGEVNWLINDALHMEVPVPVITLSVMQLFASREQNQIWAKAIAMMRHGFGGHPFGEDQGIKHERESGKVGDFLKEKG